MKAEDYYNPNTDRMVNSISRAYSTGKVSHMAEVLKKIVDTEGESFYENSDEEKFLLKYRPDFDPNAAECIFQFIESRAAHYVLNQPSCRWNKKLEEEMIYFTDGNRHLERAFVFLGKCVAYSVGMEVSFSSVTNINWPKPSTYKK